MSEDLEEKLEISNKELFSKFMLEFHEKMNKIWSDIGLTDLIMAHVKTRSESSGMAIKSLQRNFTSLIRLDVSQGISKKNEPIINKSIVKMDSISFKRSLSELFGQIDKICTTNADAQAFQFMRPFAVSIVQVRL
jgi:hypothetical protein